MPCFTEPPSSNWTENLLYFIKESIKFIEDGSLKELEVLLCSLCKKLSKKQLEYVDGLDGWQGLFQWYIQHLLHDYSENYKIETKEYLENVKNEAIRLGHIIEKEKEGVTSIKPISNQIGII